MASDYPKIKEENKTVYGTDVGEFGRDAADRYADRTHFIIELLQNAEDALDRPNAGRGSRQVDFLLSNKKLRVSHFGAPFTEDDVRGICKFFRSTKDSSAIGRFGLGFKSVYAFTDRPQVHSGSEHFAIENYVWPVLEKPIVIEKGQTIIDLPLREGDEAGHNEIADGLRKLGAIQLLFLSRIERIHWGVEGGQSGSYVRTSTQEDGEVRRVTLVTEKLGQEEVREHWLVFSRPVIADNGYQHRVEIAFTLTDEANPQLRPIQHSPLVAFFPTTFETNLGFLVQGPYRTTTSRDSVKLPDPWNQQLVSETASLLVSALEWMRDNNNFLDSAALRCLPINAEKFSDQTMFAPVFSAAKEALRS